MCEKVKILSLAQICVCLVDPLRQDPQSTKQGSRHGRKHQKERWWRENGLRNQRFSCTKHQEAFLVWKCSRTNIQAPVRRQWAVRQLSGHLVDLCVLPELALVNGPGVSQCAWKGRQWCWLMFLGIISLCSRLLSAPKYLSTCNPTLQHCYHDRYLLCLFSFLWSGPAVPSLALTFWINEEKQVCDQKQPSTEPVERLLTRWEIAWSMSGKGRAECWKFGLYHAAHSTLTLPLLLLY